MKRWSLLLIGILLLSTTNVFSQSNLKVDSRYNNLSWNNFVIETEKDFGVRYFFNQSEIENFNVQIDKKQSLKQFLTNILKPYNIKVAIDKSLNIFLTKDKNINTKLPGTYFPKVIIKQEEAKTETADVQKKESFLKTSKEFIANTINIGSKERGINKTRLKLTGAVKNANTGLVVPNATIIDQASGKGALSDKEGKFSFTLDKGSHVLIISSVNILEKYLKINMLSDGNVDIWVEDKVIMLDDLEIRANQNNKVKGTDMGVENLTSKSVEKIPLVFGEKDIIKVALLLPGVQTIGEGSAGFNVRGSPTDQNIFYINNVPVYNTSHASGFFSAFNSDAVDKFSLHKSNIPIEYGGRISSIFDIKTKQGKRENVTANGGIGFITGRVLAEGPIKKDKSSFLVGFRSTYSDWAINMFTKNEKVRNSSAKFMDLVTNFSFQLNEKNVLNVFSYYSNDNMKLAATHNDIHYENAGASIIWNHYFKNHSFNLSLIHSLYKYDETGTGIEHESFINSNQLQHSEIKANFNLNFNKDHAIKFGVNTTLYNNDIGKRLPISDLNPFAPVDFGKEKGLETAIYLGDEWKVNDRLLINGGLRFNLFSYLGPRDINIYKEGLPLLPDNLLEVKSYDSNKFIKTYYGLDYRLSARYLINDDISVKIAYNKLHQFIYVLSNTIAISPNYKWKLIDNNTKPISGDQISAGIFSNFLGGFYEVSLEGYYKKSKNIVEIKDGADILTNKDLEQVTLQGNLDAYGLEFMLKKPKGTFTGWINYTYSHSKVLVDSEFAENRINFGKTYNSNFDKPHNLNVVGNYNFSRRFSMSANFVYSTGRPITYPSAHYEYANGRRLNYSERNAYRLPDYYRLDLSFTLEGNLKKRKVAHGSWTLSIYNVLGRNNAYSVYFQKEENIIKGYKLSIFASPIISLTYNFKLGNYDN